MPRVRCPQRRCIFWEEDYCTAEEIELDPEQLSCLTMEELEDGVVEDEEIWDDEDLLEDEEEWLDDEEEDELDEDEEEWTDDEEEDEVDGFAIRGKDRDQW